jgi:membrane protein
MRTPAPQGEPFTVRGFLRLVRESMYQWSRGRAFVYAAALAFYTIFSIVPLVTLLINLAVSLTGAYHFERQLISLITQQYSLSMTPLDTAGTTDQILKIVQQQAGTVPAAYLSELIQNSTPASGGVAATVISVLFLLYGASTVFHQLLNSLNAMYGLPENFTTIRHGILYYLIARLLSAFVVVLMGILFVVLLAINVILTTLPPTPVEIFLADFPGTQLLLRFIFAPFVTTLVLAALYKFLPGGRMRWRDVFPGTLLTAILIAGGNRVIGFYLERIFGATLYGASGTVVLFLIWIYYIAMIVLFGAKFIALYCQRYGVPITPKRRLLPSRSMPLSGAA